jgi:hypothetical protein
MYRWNIGGTTPKMIRRVMILALALLVGGCASVAPGVKGVLVPLDAHSQETPDYRDNSVYQDCKREARWWPGNSVHNDTMTLCMLSHDQPVTLKLQFRSSSPVVAIVRATHARAATEMTKDFEVCGDRLNAQNAAEVGRAILNDTLAAHFALIDAVPGTDAARARWAECMAPRGYAVFDRGGSLISGTEGPQTH